MYKSPNNPQLSVFKLNSIRLPHICMNQKTPRSLFRNRSPYFSGRFSVTGRAKQLRALFLFFSLSLPLSLSLSKERKRQRNIRACFRSGLLDPRSVRSCLVVLASYNTRRVACPQSIDRRHIAEDDGTEGRRWIFRC